MCCYKLDSWEVVSRLVGACCICEVRIPSIFISLAACAIDVLSLPNQTAIANRAFPGGILVAHSQAVWDAV